MRPWGRLDDAHRAALAAGAGIHVLVRGGFGVRLRGPVPNPAILRRLVVVGWFLLGRWTEGVVDTDEAGQATAPTADRVGDSELEGDRERSCPDPDPEADTD